MIPIASKLESQAGKFTELREILEGYQFALGGNWEYDKGSFDHALENEHKVWLRIPFEVIDGNLDSERSENNAQIKLGTPYVLKHLYNEGNDPEASVRVVGALFDQFQAPVDPDADVEQHWVEQAGRLLQEVEQKVLK